MVVGHGMLEHLVLRMVLLLLLVMMLRRWMMSPNMMLLLVEGSEALSGTVLDILYMGNENALFWMRLWVWSIVDIRIVTLLVSWSIRHAWSLPRRTSSPPGQSKYVLDHSWVVVCFQKARGCRRACLFLGAVRLFPFR
jgi:hypothetical protein